MASVRWVYAPLESHRVEEELAVYLLSSRIIRLSPARRRLGKQGFHSAQCVQIQPTVFCGANGSGK